MSDARRHLSERTGSRQTVFTVPLPADSVQIKEIVGDSRVDTTGLLLALTVDPETLRVGLGDKLRFTGVNFDAFAYDFSEILQTAEVGIQTPTITLAPGFSGAALVSSSAGLDTAEFVTPNGSQIETATVAGGYVVLTINSSLTAAAKVTVLIRDQSGPTTSIGPLTVPAAGGGVVIARDSTNLAGVTLTRFATLSVSVQPLGFGGSVPTGSIQALATFRPLRLQSVTLANVNETFTTSYQGLAGETRLTSLDTLVTRAGAIALNVGSRLPLALSFGITLRGTRGPGGAPLTGTLSLPAAPGDGSQVTGSVTFNLAGVTIVPDSVRAEVTGAIAAVGPVVISQAMTSSAVEVSGGATIEVERLSGRLDPALTPELNVAIEQFSEVDKAGFDFGDLEEAITAMGFNDVSAAVRVTNASGTPLVLRNTTLRVVRLDGAGAPVRDGLGNLVFERDSAGAILSAPLAAPGQSELAIPRGVPGTPGSANVAVQMGPLVTRMVRILFANPAGRAAVVASGTAEAGDGAGSTISYADSVRVTFGLTARLDLTLPDTGIVITRINASSGAGLSPADSADVVRLLDSASVTFTVTSSAPVKVVVSPAYVSGNRAQVFGQPGVVTLPNLVLPAAQVNADGTGGVPTTGTIALGITGLTAGALLGDSVTMGVRIRLLPGDPAHPRAALRPSDLVRISGSARIAVTPGAQQP